MLLYYRNRGLHALLSLSSAIGACGLFGLVAHGIFASALGRPLADPGGTYVICTVTIAVAIIFNGMRLSLKQVDLADLEAVAAARLSMMQVTGVVFSLFFVLVAMKEQNLSRLILATYIPLLFLLLFLANLRLPRLFARLLFSGKQCQRTMLIGTPKGAVALRKWLERKRIYGIEVVGLLSDEADDAGNCELPILGSPEDLKGQIKAKRCTQVIFIGFPHSSEDIRGWATTCENSGVRFMVLADWARMLGRRLTLISEHGMHLLSFQAEPLQCPWNRVLKRVLDLTLAVPVILFVLPWLTFLVWLVQRFQSPGPIFFRQRRTGTQGREFIIFKYRTMQVDNQEESRQATADDDRVFTFGRWLRRLSLDEFPQFVNVLLGQMSVVGPRPHIPAHDEQFEVQMRRYRIRGLVKPGITGLAQVKGFRGETRSSGDVIRRIRADLQYIQEWTFVLDLLIVAKTAYFFLRPQRSSY